MKTENEIEAKINEIVDKKKFRDYSEMRARRDWIAALFWVLEKCEKSANKKDNKTLLEEQEEFLGRVGEIKKEFASKISR